MALVILFASFFHETAYIAALIYPISLFVEGRSSHSVIDNNRGAMKYSKENSKNRALIIVAFLSLVVSLSLEKIFFSLSNISGLNLSRYNHYFEDQDVSGGKIIRLFLFTSCFAYFLVKRKNNKDNKMDMLNTLFAYSEISLFFTLGLFSGASSYIVRMAYYFDFFALIYIPLIIYKICDGEGEYEKFSNKKIQNKIIEYSIIVFVVILYWLITYVIRNGAHTYPYAFMKE
ncbi:EpsG family protein [Ruminococcus flavefaciens]|uniref:EpsG family protein n=1 Tax=Ruminococcus flavefaciens TaxID=1265 RepID=A0A1H6ICJ4_RUMFL|nr:EpsG family protein [Ruminococcus flavefaciens]